MKWLIIALLTLTSAFASISSRIQAARPGSFIVTQAKKNVTLLHLHSQNDQTFILEEICAPAHSNKDLTWKTWVERGAPGHTSWTLYEVDKQSGELLECFSFTHQSWMQPDQTYLLQLMHLPLKHVSEKNRKKIGAEPPHHAIDIRKIWNPPKIVDGQKVPGTFQVMKTRWPKDDSELGNRKIEIYFDADASFPFPYWVEVEGIIDQKIRTIDSGKDLQSPRTHLPRRYPRPLGPYEKRGNQLHIKIDTPKYYSGFELFETTDKTTSKPCQIKREQSTLEVIIDPKQIGNGKLTITPKSHPHIFVELPPIQEVP